MVGAGVADGHLALAGEVVSVGAEASAGVATLTMATVIRASDGVTTGDIIPTITHGVILTMVTDIMQAITV